MANNTKLAGIAHSKLRDAIGLVGIEVDQTRQLIAVRLVKHWSRTDLNKIAPDISRLWGKAPWHNTIIDMQVGDHVIQGLRRTAGLPVKVIQIKKKVSDPADIRRVRSLDLTEMTQFTLQQKMAHRIQFPRKPSENMKQLEMQISMFSEVTTEAGSVAYYAPGTELDDLTKALMLAIFAARPLIGDGTGKIIGGPITGDGGEISQQSIDEMFNYRGEPHKPRRFKNAGADNLINGLNF